MDEDRDSSTPPWPGRETIGYGLHRPAEQQNGGNGSVLTVPAGDLDSAGTHPTEEKTAPLPSTDDARPTHVPSVTEIEVAQSRKQETPAAPLDTTATQVTPEKSEKPKQATGIPIETVLTNGVQGFSEQANACANKAAQFAYHLKHAMIGSDHLMLALTLDENARPLLAALGNVKQLRESAARILGETNAKYLGAPARSDAFDPVLTDDLFEIFATARRAAAGRCQQVAVSDLVNAFPQENGKLIYGRVDAVDPVPAVAERLERRISDFMTTFERRMMEDMQRQLTGLVRDFGSALSARLDEIAPIDDVTPREIAAPPNPGFEIAGSTPPEGQLTQEKSSEGFWERCGWKR